jgi:putative endonuclease
MGWGPLMAFWVYMLRCADGSFYVGHTDDLDRRLAQHQSGGMPGCYTFRRRPVQPVFCQDFASREEALSMERRLKGWTRAKKQALIAGDWAAIHRLGRGRNRNERAVSSMDC